MALRSMLHDESDSFPDGAVEKGFFGETTSESRGIVTMMSLFLEGP
jgi:hypothetical protein